MIYADYSYYKDTYRGKMPETDFDRLSRQASAYLDEVTFGRATRAPEQYRGNLKDACCAVTDEMHRQGKGGELASETVGKWSRNYVATGQSPEERLYETARRYLGLTGLMCRSVNA
ncbi:hypothetical protein RWV98_17615 [Agathobaculum sp. NTUH-O15-33]|uniref:hypothetical protein n=1 Tax=Agathobaculum sp. NTUH-O15-33 TaxID=3079302 RepID=UPI002958648F|nr:hypothetical protein [Agathobaculum sp. NTUH-O15-33]WNX84370.1 hypothetical protein RWV98_17615 [Agathobaculum sp. NTUH-O15-33]